MPGHDASRPRRGWTRGRRSRVQQPSPEDELATENVEHENHEELRGLQVDSSGECIERLTRVLNRAREPSVEDWAPILMTGDYLPYLEAEAAQLAELQGQMAGLVQPSSYRLHLTLDLDWLCLCL